jgi:hypothetical protein
MEEQLVVNDDLVLLQDQKPLRDTVSIVEKQKDNVYYWDPGSIEIMLPKGARAVALDATDAELCELENRMTISFKNDWERIQRDSVSRMSLTIVSGNGDSTIRTLAIKWKGIAIPDSLWQKITLQPAKISKISMYPGEKRSIQFVWNYPHELSGLLKAEVADQATTETTPHWRKVSLEKKKFTSSWVYGQNVTARFRIIGRKGQKEVSFAVVSKVI